MGAQVEAFRSVPPRVVEGVDPEDHEVLNITSCLRPAWYHRALNKYKAVRMLRVAIAMFGQMLLWWCVCRCCNLSAIFYPFCSLCSVPAGCMT